MLISKTTIVATVIGIALCSIPSARADFGDGDDCGVMGNADNQNCPSPQQIAAQTALASRQASVMRGQMQRVATYMELYCQRNSRFPEYGDQMNEAQAEMTALVQNNPYNAPDVRVAGTSPQPGFDANGKISGTSDLTYDENTVDPTSGQISIASQLDRIRLYRDDSLSPGMVNYYIKHPPSDWEAPAGTISVIGSNNGMVMVWGAGRNGRPIRDDLTGGTMIISGMWGRNSQDMNSPNEDI